MNTPRLSIRTVTVADVIEEVGRLPRHTLAHHLEQVEDHLQASRSEESTYAYRRALAATAELLRSQLINKHTIYVAAALRAEEAGLLDYKLSAFWESP